MTTQANASYAILLCNGMDKAAGAVTRQIALDLAEQTGSEIICPVLYRVADARYSRVAQELPLLVLDGCGTRCASKLAAEKGLKVARKLTVSEEAKRNGIPLADSLRGAELAGALRLDAEAVRLANMLVAALREPAPAQAAGPQPQMQAAEPLEYETYQKDKFIFRLPKAGFLFSENDFWVRVSGNRARVGMTDFLQQSLSDIAFYDPPTVGDAIEQFGELGTIESAKAVLEVVSPLGGKVVAVNGSLDTSPERINESPYEEGWLVELEPAEFEQDRELLLDFAGYFPIMKRKVDEFQVK